MKHPQELLKSIKTSGRINECLLWHTHTHCKNSRNPHISLFAGILLTLALCREVDVYEYIPSVRQTDLCHYHERYYDAACTLGAYHPLLYEKLLVHRMNVASELDLMRKGKVTLPGFSSIHCGTWPLTSFSQMSLVFVFQAASPNVYPKPWLSALTAKTSTLHTHLTLHLYCYQ